MVKRIAAAIVVLVLLGVTGFAGYQVGMGRWSVPWLPRNGTLQFLVEDAPGQLTWSHVNITFATLEVHRADAGNDSGWSPVPFTSSRTVDLKALNNVSQLLGQASLTAGKYTQIRIILEKVEGTLANGTKVDIRVPSNTTKINQPFNVTTGGTTKIILDIPLDNIHWEAGGYVLNPVVGSSKVQG